MKPDARAIRQHLDLLFGEAAIEHPDEQIELRALGQRAVAEMFRLDQIDRAVAWAERLNLRGRNVYVGVNTRRAGARSGGEADIARAYWQFVDADDAASVGRLRNGVAVRPAFEVVTGRQPHERLHCYWRLDGAVENLKAWRETQEALRDHFKTDNVVDPPRIMRLAGTISYPGADKQARGYVEELVTLSEREDAEAVTPWGLRQTFAARSPRDEVPAAEPGFALDLGPVRAEVDALIDAAKAQGAWNANALRVVGALVNRGADDAFIHVALEPTYRGMDWRDPLEKRRLVQSMIDRTRAKWAEDLAAKEREIVAVGGSREPGRIRARSFDATWFDRLRPREFIFGRHLIRKYISATVSPGGVGKTTLALLEAISIATGENLTGVAPEQAVNVWHYNLEDDLDEITRRVWAICAHYRIDPRDLEGRLFLSSGRDERLIVAQPGPDRSVIATPDVEEVIGQMVANNIGVLQVDPLIRSHFATENANDEMDVVFQQFIEIAHRSNAAVDLIHHTRKSGQGATAAVPGDIESARGAGSLAGAIRAGRTVTVMSQAEAEKFGIEEARRRWFIRVDDAKANMQPPAESAVWYERKSVELPNGENVGTLGRWTPPDAFDGLSNETARDILNAIDAGLPDGQRYIARRGNGTNRWVGAVLEDHDFGAAQAQEIVKAWVRSGVLVVEDYTNPVRRRSEKGIAVDRSKMPTV